MNKTPLFLCMEKTGQFTRFGLEDECDIDPSLPIRAVCHYSSSPSCDSGCCDDFWIVDSEGEVFISGGGDYWRHYDITEHTNTLNGTIQLLRETVAAVDGVTNTRVVAGLYRLGDDDYFFARRAGDRAYSGCWEFTGGKVEPGETDEQALIREWSEELGVNITVGKMLCGSIYNGIHVFLYEVFVNGDPPFEPKPGIHDEYAFWSLQEFLAALEPSGPLKATPSTKPFVRFLIGQTTTFEDGR